MFEYPKGVVFVACPCCSIIQAIYPTHPMYDLLASEQMLQLQREDAPDVYHDEGGD